MTTLFHALRAGDHVVACDDVYGGTFRILDKVMKPFGLETTWVDMTDPQINHLEGGSQELFAKPVYPGFNEINLAGPTSLAPPTMPLQQIPAASLPTRSCTSRACAASARSRSATCRPVTASWRSRPTS